MASVSHLPEVVGQLLPICWTNIAQQTMMTANGGTMLIAIIHKIRNCHLQQLMAHNCRCFSGVFEWCVTGNSKANQPIGPNLQH